jgi:hypothetical protein
VPQFFPAGTLVTTPPPPFATVNVATFGPNVAVTVVGAAIVTLQVLEVAAQLPDDPTMVQPFMA